MLCLLFVNIINPIKENRYCLRWCLAQWIYTVIMIITFSFIFSPPLHQSALCYPATLLMTRKIVIPWLSICSFFQIRDITFPLRASLHIYADVKNGLSLFIRFLDFAIEFIYELTSNYMMHNMAINRRGWGVSIYLSLYAEVRRKYLVSAQNPPSWVNHKSYIDFPSTVNSSRLVCSELDHRRAGDMRVTCGQVPSPQHN